MKEKSISKKSVVSSNVSSINDFPAVPCLYARLRRVNYGIRTLTATMFALEEAITQAPINLQIMEDNKKLDVYIKAQEVFGVIMTKEQARVLLGIIRNNETVTVRSNVRNNETVTVRSNESLELKENDVEVLKLYKRYGFLTHTEFCKTIQADGITVTSSVLSRYSNLTKQIAYLQGKQGNNGYLQDIQKGDPIDMLQQLSAHPKYKSDASTFALCKRAVRIYAALT